MADNTTKRFDIFNYLWLLVIPLSYNFWATDPALYHKFLLIDISLLALLGMLFTGKNKLPALSRQAGIFMGLYTASVLLALAGMQIYQVNNADGWFVWLHLMVFPVFVLLLLMAGNTAEKNTVNIAVIISWLAGISVLVAAVQYAIEISANGWSLAAADALKASYTHKNIFAEVMLLTLPFAFYAFTATRKKMYLLVVAATLLFIGLSLSRAVLSGLVVAALLSAGAYAVANFKQSFSWRYALFIIIAVTVVTAGAYGFVNHTAYGRGLMSFYNYRNTIHERQNIWHATVQLIKTHPFFGIGLGAWKVLNLQYSVLGLRNYVTFFQQPHNDFLWILSEQGIISFVLLAAAWLYLAALLFIRIFRKPAVVFNYCLLFALTGYLVYANFSFPRERAEHGIILAFIAAFILSDSKPASSFALPRFTGFAFALLLTVAAWWAGNKIMSQVYMRNALEYRAENDLQQEFSALQKINSTYYTLDGTATPVSWYRGMVYYMQHNNAAALAEFKEALRYNPYHAYSLANVGTCISAAGDNEGTQQYFRQALAYAPGFPDAALNMCAIKFNKGQVDSAAWYLSMANDSLSDTRYVQFLQVLTNALVKPIMDSAALYAETPLADNCHSLLTHPQWQMDLFKKAFKHKRPVSQQVWMDILWIIKYREKKLYIADKYKKSLSLPPI